MLTRLLLWLVIGLILGLLAAAANLAPARSGKGRWLAAPALGAVVALAGSLLTSVLLDDMFATYAAIWLPIAAFGVAWLASGGRRAPAGSKQ